MSIDQDRHMLFCLVQLLTFARSVEVCVEAVADHCRKSDFLSSWILIVSFIIYIAYIVSLVVFHLA